LEWCDKLGYDPVEMMERIKKSFKRPSSSPSLHAKWLSGGLMPTFAWAPGVNTHVEHWVDGLPLVFLSIRQRTIGRCQWGLMAAIGEGFGGRTCKRNQLIKLICIPNDQRVLLE
jgi:hypothetical protein